MRLVLRLKCGKRYNNVMNDLFKKLNVLVKSSLNDLVGEGSSRPSSAPRRLGKDIDREVAALRQRVNDALDYEDELKTRIATLEDEVARFDEQADEALRQQREEQARYVVEQMQRSQQRLTMARADLREHQLVAQELMQRVNTLEAYVAEARRAQQDASEAASGGLADTLRSVREKLTREALPPQDSVEEHRAPDVKAIEDDLERRRQRLSKR
jgi:chromosome segregation ATPase